MVVLGLLLLVASGLLTARVVLDNTDTVSVAAFGHSVSGLTLGGLFAAGVAAGLRGLLGLLMMLAGARRRRTRRAGMKQQIRDARGEKESLAEENARLRSELEARTGGAGNGAVDGTADGTAVYPADETVGRHTRAGLFHR